jgi:hypothetical protein
VWKKPADPLKMCVEATQSASEILGSPPWSDEQLTCAYSADFIGIYRALQKHPGYRFHAELESLALSERLFEFAVCVLKQAVEAFRRHSGGAEFRTRAAAAATDHAILAVQAGIFQAATTASAFKERARILGKRVDVPGFQKRFDGTFTQNNRHQFVQELRGHLSHPAPLSADWELSRAGRHAPQVARFLFFVEDLSQVAKEGQGWREPARRFIESHRRNAHPHGGEIDVVRLFEVYLADVHVFYTWLLGAAENAAGTSLTEYRESENRFHRIATRMAWRAFMIPMLKQAPDPRALLNPRFTADELAVVDAMPTGSKEQVGQLITFINDAEYGFIDAEIEGAIFRAFGL